jgi:hypothetical protein
MRSSRKPGLLPRRRSIARAGIFRQRPGRPILPAMPPISTLSRIVLILMVVAAVIQIGVLVLR